MFAIMDSNENENYYQKNSKPVSDVCKGAIPKVSAAKYQNQYNNNNNVAEQENLMPQVNGSDAGRNPAVQTDCERDSKGADPVNGVDTHDPKTNENCVNGKCDYALSNEPFPNENLEAKSLESEEDELNDGEYSDDNSLGNLSNNSENGLIEEIILLPNNIYSDDENESASDDCIYAYRGDDQAPALLEYRGQPADDETDFLEMDFDPEPSSELENLLEHHEIDVSPFQVARNVDRHSTQEIDKISSKSPLCENNAFVKKQEEPPDEADGALAASIPVPIELKNTGAIPKKFTPSQELKDYELPGPSKPTKRGNTKNLKLDLKLCTDSGTEASSYPYSYYDYVQFEMDDDDDDESICLDCTEKEFLMQTKQDLSIQKVCRSCHSRNTNFGGQHHPGNDYFYDSGQPLNSSNSETDLMSIRAEQIVLQALNKINELKATPPSLGFSRSMEEVCIEMTGAQRDQEVPIHLSPEVCGDSNLHTLQSVTIYTLNCGEMTIIEALTRIGVAPNLDILRQYFNDQYAVDISKMNIPQYLLYMSKRDCNFKKLIEAIKSCSDEPLDVQYYPLDPFSDIPEVVSINSSEIAKRWNENTNLRQIINFKHKHFHTLNVLGKIVNILRQPSRGRYTNQSINIPQYYKSGSITIARIT